MLKKLVLKSSNYLYVFHTGDFENMRFMGMTEEAYKKVKGSYKVWCFPETSKTLEDTISDIEEDFSLDKDIRNLSLGIKKEECIDCAKEFYTEALNCKYIKDLQLRYYLIDRSKRKGVLYNNFNKLIHYIPKVIDIVPKLSTDYIIDFSGLLNEVLDYGKKSTDLGTYISRSYNGGSKYCVVGIAENDTTTIVQLQVNITLNMISDFDDLEGLFLKSSKLSFDFNRDYYFLS